MHPRLSQIYGRFVITAGLMILVGPRGPPGPMIRAFGEDSFVLAVLHRQERTCRRRRTARRLRFPMVVTLGPARVMCRERLLARFRAPRPQPSTDCPRLPRRRPSPIRPGPGPRLAPQPRVSSAITSADPVLTRFALGRSNDGSQFGMFMQVFADGTVVDSEGVHHLRPADLRPIVDAVQSGDAVPTQGTLRGARDRFHRVRANCRVRASIRPAHGPFVLVFGKPSRM